MRHTAIIAALVVAAAPLAVPHADVAYARSFVVERLYSDVRVEADGSASVTEWITYRFDGEFSYAFRTIPLRTTDRVEDVEVAEAGSPYTRSTSRVHGSYAVERGGDAVEITWHYRARNETRTFEVSYTLFGAVARHGDVADFYYTLFDNETGAGVGEVSTTVTLPDGVFRDELHVFAHGPLHGEVAIVSENTVTAALSPLPDGESFDVRVLLPPGLFPAISAVDADTRGEILAEERALAQAADHRRLSRVEEAQRRRAENQVRARHSRALLPVAVLLGLFAPGIWFVWFCAHGRPHEVASHTAPGDIPSDRPPALVAFLLSRSVAGPALVATIVDLAERGHLTVQQSQAEKAGWLGKSSTEDDYRFERVRGADDTRLRPFEKSLLVFMVDEVGDGRGFSMNGLTHYGRKHARAVRKWFAEWTKEVKAESAAGKFFEPYPVSAMVLNAAVGLCVAAAGGVICAAAASPAGVPAIIGGSLQMVLTAALSRRTPEGQRELDAWKQFRAHLKRTTKARGALALASRDWSRYLAAAILFGMHKKIVPHLTVSDGRRTHPYPAWYGAIASGGAAAGFSAMIASVSSTVASSTGAGGGASGGGGGGAGGGSAGAG